MERLNVWYFHTLGHNIGEFKGALFSYAKLNHWKWTQVAEALRGSLESLKNQRMPLFPKSSEAAGDLLGVLVNFAGLIGQDRAISNKELEVMLREIDRFHSVYEQELEDSYTFLVTDIGAYSSGKLLERADVHLTRASQMVINENQKRDYKAAGRCLALDLHTASGFHAMRVVEEEARIYHKVVTGVELNEAPLGALISGDDRVKGSGLKKKYAEEGSPADSQLGLIISMLSQLNKIYRCRIMHPDMTLDYDEAKQVFDITAMAVSAIIEDGAKRSAEQAKAAAEWPKT